MFKAFVSGNGWADISGSITVSREAYTVAAQQMSYNGGFLNVQGNNISPASYIMIGGKKGMYHDANGGTARFRIPPLVTA